MSSSQIFTAFKLWTPMSHWLCRLDLRLNCQSISKMSMETVLLMILKALNSAIVYLTPEFSKFNLTKCPNKLLSRHKAQVIASFICIWWIILKSLTLWEWKYPALSGPFPQSTYILVVLWNSSWSTPKISLWYLKIRALSATGKPVTPQSCKSVLQTAVHMVWKRVVSTWCSKTT